MSDGEVQEYSKGFLCIYPGPYVRWDGPRVYYWCSYVYIQGSMADGKVPEYNTGSLSIYPGPYVRWEGPRLQYWNRIHVLGALCQVGWSQSIIQGSFVNIPGPMSGGKVPEYRSGFLCIYPGLYVSWEGPRV